MDAGGPYSMARMTRDDDLDEVAALEAASFTNPWTREMLARELSHSDVARVYGLRGPDGRLLAFCACWIVFDELHINTLAVVAERRREGLATRLLGFLFAEAAAAGVSPGHPGSAPIERGRAPPVRTAWLQRQGRPDRVLHESRGGRTGSVARQFPRPARPRASLKQSGSCATVPL